MLSQHESYITLLYLRESGKSAVVIELLEEWEAIRFNLRKG